jgi:hypothetical protein
MERRRERQSLRQFVIYLYVPAQRSDFSTPSNMPRTFKHVYMQLILHELTVKRFCRSMR